MRAGSTQAQARIASPEQYLWSQAVQGALQHIGQHHAEFVGEQQDEKNGGTAPFQGVAADGEGQTQCQEKNGQTQHMPHQGIMYAIGSGGEGAKERHSPGEMAVNEPGQRLVDKQDEQRASRQRKCCEEEESAERHDGILVLSVTSPPDPLSRKEGAPAMLFLES